MRPSNQVPPLLDLAAFFAVFATLYGAVRLALGLLSLGYGTFDSQSVLVGAGLLATSFAIFRAHDRARKLSRAA